MVLAPAAAILSTGGIWTSDTVLQTAMLAKSLNIGVTIASEMMKLVLWKRPAGDQARASLRWHQGDEGRAHPSKEGKLDSPMTVMPAEYITQFVTEDGVMPASAVAEEAINIWF